MAGPVYQLHVLLRGVEPAVWRWLLVPGDTGLAELHGIVQAAFSWGDVRGHSFVIRGDRSGGPQAPVLSESAGLAAFRFRVKERFLYNYGLVDEWQRQTRFEGTPVLSGDLAVPECIAGARAGPGEACATPRDYADRLSLQLGDAPLAERLYVGEGLARLAYAQPEETVREAIGDVGAFVQAVQCLGVYDRLNPERFDRHEVNRKLRAFAQGDEHWRELDDDNDTRDDRRARTP